MSLAAKLWEAQTALAAGDAAGACSTLRALGKELEAQSGKKVPDKLAPRLVAAAQRVEAVLGC